MNDLTPMPFGKYKGLKMQDVPVSYLHYLWNSGKLSDEVYDYIADNMDALKLENKDLIWS